MTQDGGARPPPGSSPRIVAGHYRIERELGRGGMATVFLCTDLRDDREVAFKVLSPEAANAVTRERFLREVTFVAGLDHPAIPKVIESGLVGDDPFYVMTYVKGESLRARLDREKQLPLPEAVRIAREIVKPMKYAHDRSIVHRDIKPDNILLSDDKVFVLDFGIARAIAASADERLTRTGMAVGTPAYMSPEQALADRKLDWRSDIYSLGCLVYEMIAGEPPFTGASPKILMVRRFSSTPRPLHEVRPDVPESLDRAVARAMSRAPEDRWQTAQAFGEALDLAAPVAAMRVTGETAVPLPLTLGAPGASPDGAAGESDRRGDDLLEQLQSTFAGTYRVDLEMKSGGMSRLFLATDPGVGRRVVIRILPHQPMLARFRRESEVTARLQHPHILPVISAGVRDGLAHYVMPFFEGESLRDRLEREGRLSVSDGVRILSEVSDALSYAHQQGVVHRDIRPENILIQDGHAVLADFGIAAAMSGGHGTGELPSGMGLSLGAAGYMAPEQTLGEGSVDARADIYAVGVVGYEIFAGAPPFTGATEQAILVAHLTRDAVRLDDVRDDIPLPVAEAIMTAMQRDPAARFQTAAEFHDALDGVRVGTQTATAISFQPRLFRLLSRKWKIVVPAIALAAVAGIAVAVKLGNTPVSSEFVTIAIAPFNTPQSALALWREGMVDVLARNLDGAGPLRTVSPALAVKGFPAVADQRSASQLARGTNARYAIFGTVTALPDSVEIRATLVDAATGSVWERSVRDNTVETASARLTLAVLEKLGKSHGIGAVRQSSFGSTSIEAVRAFLRGEQFYRRTSWDSAAVSYLRAISLDSDFALALRRAAQVTAWQRNEADSLARTFRLRAGSANHGLGPRDSLLVVADSLSAALAPLPGDSMNWQMLSRLFATLNDAARRYPDDPEVWYAVGEARFHQGYGSPVNISERQALEAFERSIALDSAFAPAYVHAVELALTLDGAEVGTRYSDAYLKLDSTDDEAEGISIVHQVARSPAGSSAIPRDVSIESTIAAYFIIRRWPDSAQTAVRLLESAGRSAKSSPSYASDSGRLAGFLPAQLAYRGRLGDAYRALGNQPSRLFAELALLGGIPADTASAVFSRWLRERRPQAFHALPWLADRRDTTQIRLLIGLADSAARAGTAFSMRGARYRAASARAYLSLARLDTTNAMARFAALPDTLCISCYVDRMRFARLLAARGRLPEAEKLLGERINSFLTPIEISMALDRGRVAGKLGKPAEALRAYTLVVAAWSRTDAVLQPFVAEAKREIDRLRPQRPDG